MPTGRPTKYNPAFVQQVAKYIATTGREQTKIATLYGLALHLKVTRETLNEWAKIHPAFSDAISELSNTQAEQLINDGIYGGKEVNSTIVKLLLMNNHGMREKTDMTSDLEPIKTLDVGTLLTRVYGQPTTNGDAEVSSDS